MGSPYKTKIYGTKLCSPLSSTSFNLCSKNIKKYKLITVQFNSLFLGIISFEIKLLSRVLRKLLIQAHSYPHKFTKLLLASSEKEAGTWYFSMHQNNSKP
jgi:hypothetical protein